MNKTICKLKNSFIVAVMAVFAFAVSAQAQKISVTGTVTDQEGEPLVGVTVRTADGAVATATDINGKYNISFSKPAKLRFTYVGMEEYTVKVSQSGVVNVELATSSQLLDDVVVVGFGTQRKINLTGAVQSVNSDEILRRNTSNGSVALQGIIPGLTATQSSGQPGGDNATLRIRGIGSLNSTNSPLILIDGIEGDMNRIDLNSVETISVLKDAASASIYGSKAANGVILVTTKRGSNGKAKVTFNGYVGWNKPTAVPEACNALEYMAAMNVAQKNIDKQPTYSEEYMDIYRNGLVDNVVYHDTDWIGEVLKSSAMMQNYSVSVRGGNERIKVYADAGYYHQDGLINLNEFARTTMRLNADLNVNKYFSLGLNTSVRDSKAVNPTAADAKTIISYAYTFSPLISGVYAGDDNNGKKFGYGLNGSSNPIAFTRMPNNKSTSSAPEYLVRPQITIRPVDGLSIVASYTWKRNDGRTVAFMEPWEAYDNGEYKGTFSAPDASRSETQYMQVKKQYNVNATYEKDFGKNYVKAMVGFQSDDIKYNSISAGRQKFLYEGYDELVNGDPTTATNNSYLWGWSMLSYMFRLNYAWDSKYLIEVNGRYDGSSRFARGHRWGFFPSVSAGWRISQESFWEDARDVVDNLKLRASFGKLGNETISGYYPWAATVSTVTSFDSKFAAWFDETPSVGMAQMQQANTLLTWEKSKQFDLGIDFGLFNSRLNGSADFYVRHIDDMLQQFTKPAFVGLSSPWENAGSMKNTGWELSLNWADKIENVSYYARFNLSDVKNKILNLYGKEYDNGNTITREGDPYGSYYGFIAEGFFKDQEEINNSPVYRERATTAPGDIKYRDISGPNGVPDGVINSYDRTIIGNATPRFTFGLTLGAEWKGIDASIFFQGVAKRDIYYSGAGSRAFIAHGTIYKYQLDYWTEENQDAAYPRILQDPTGSSVSNNVLSTFWLKSGAYCRLKNVVIGYTLPKKWTRKAFISKVRVYASGQNLFTIRNNFYRGFDPETSVGSGASLYPVNKSFICGLNVEF